MCNRRRVIFLACLLLAAEQKVAEAAPVTFTTTAPIDDLSFNQGDFINIDISPLIQDADELISISGGIVSGAESGNFEIIGVFESGPDEVIATIPNNHTTIPLAIVNNETFPSGDLRRITFHQDNSFGLINIPAGTIFTFDAVAGTAVPEPSTLALLGTGLLGAGAVSRRRGKRTAAGLASGT